MHSNIPAEERSPLCTHADVEEDRLHIGFVMSTELGLKTQCLNWRGGLVDPQINADWIVIDWWEPYGLFKPLGRKINSAITRTIANRQLRVGLARGPFDALFLAGHMLRAVRSALQLQPYFLALDTTPKQLSAFGALYGKEAFPIASIERHRHQARVEQYQHAAALFPWSHWCATSIIQDYGVNPDRVHVIPPGVDLDYWQCGRRTANDLVHVLFVGGDFDRKGGGMLLEWAQTTPARNWRLHLVTRNPVPTNDPRIHVYNGLNPNEEALRRLYQMADIFVLPTRGDCYSLAAVEAMAAGLPVIISRTGGTEDIIDEGRTGYLIDVPGDALKTRLEHLLAYPELRVTMGAAARIAAEQRYDVRANIRQTVQIMRQYIRQ